jgi:putative methionine-R-sulfoxide reductase with GAF domain
MLHFFPVFHRAVRHVPRCGSTRLRQLSSSPSSAVTLPSRSQLRLVALHAAIPMVGFGFMDNLVMIQAGDAIDMSLGVAFGLSTLTAAGFGQCFSDVAGLTCGGVVDATVARLNLPHHNLSLPQLDLRVSRIYRTVGGCFGVVLGCLLGMSCLFFMDTAKSDRAKKAKELQSIFESIMDKGHTLVDCDRATLWMLDEETNELWSQVATGTTKEIRVQRKSGIVGACAESGKVVNIPDAYQDDRFNQGVDQTTGYRTRSILVVPINQDGKTVGAVQMINKKMNPDGSGGVFLECDEKLVELLASHVASFIRIVNGRD